MRKFLITAAAVLGLSLANSAANACSCVPPTEAGVLSRADVGLEGRVLRVQRVGSVSRGAVIATIRVTRVLKGRLPRVIRVKTGPNSAACGINFQPGQSVRLGAYRFERNYSAGLCSSF